MSISIGGTSLYNLTANTLDTSSSTNKLESSLSGDLSNASDDQLMDVCKSFESYFVEQVIKEMKKTVSSEDEGDYVEMFGDTMMSEYASLVTEQADLGIAQTLYESMKRE